MLPSPVVRWLEEAGFGAVIRSQPVSGGCINNGARLYTSSGKTFFLKTNSHLPGDVFEREMEGLQALHRPDWPRFPEAYLAGADFLLLEDLGNGQKKPDFWETLGRRLAALHNHTHPQFGFEHNNYLGSTPQPNGWMEDGCDFFTEQRIMFQARLAQMNGYFGTQEIHLAESLCRKLTELIPAQPASLIHGDLWSGNVIADQAGSPALIDPAAHYGWAEAELGMTALFGGFPAAFYRAYESARPLQSGWRERLPVYNLYHLLNHLNLFGSGYYSQVMAILRRYGA